MIGTRDTTMDDAFEDEEIVFEVIVSRIKLRMRKNPNPNPNRGTAGKFSFQYRRKHLVDDFQFDHIIDEHDFPKRVYSASKYTPLPFRSTRSTIISALSKFDDDLDPESHQLITRHVLAFARQCDHHTNHPSSFSIDVDIKEVTGSYLIGRENEDELGWDYFEYGHWDMTHPWIQDDDDKDYTVVKYLDNMPSYAIVPCGSRGNLKAVSFTTDEVTRACTCAICLIDFKPDGEEVMMNLLKMPCGHVFHRKCIVSCILSNCETETPTCPICPATLQFL